MTLSFEPGLFDEARQPRVPGLTYVTDCVTVEAERALSRFIASLELKPFEWRGFTGNRRTISFGWRYDFNGGGFQQADPMPELLSRTRAEVAAHFGRDGETFTQCSVIEYAPGAGIGWHKDRPHFGDVMGLSLLAPCRFRLKRELAGGGCARETVLLAPRSAYLLEGEARHTWLHSIPPLTELRYSLTFRTLAKPG